MYTCNQCGYSSISKIGVCPTCGAVGSFEEKEDKKSVKNKAKNKNHNIKGNQLQSHTSKQIEFFDIKNKELERVYQKGIKKGGVYLLGGEPGIGKSTIVLQILQEILENNDIKIGYFSGEENQDQINDRASRILEDPEKIQNNLKVFNATNLEDILTTTEIEKFDLIITDSIQTVYTEKIDSIAGTSSQVKACTEKISEFCNNYNISSLIIGHVTKGGEIAGPKYLEHIVDVVSYLEGDRFGQYRFLRSMKNRFGSTDDVGIFEMTLFGLKPVYDLKDRIIQNANISIPGSVFTIGIDNGRPVIVNLEVLLNKTKYKYPQRNAIGIDPNRLNLVIAILERYLNINLGYFDIYVNIPGEFKFYDSGLDLAIACAIYGQYKNKTFDKNNIFLGEIGLGGQILKSKIHEKRKNEIPSDFNIIDYQTIKHIKEIINIV